MMMQRILFAALALCCGSAFAQAWPSKPIHIVAPYAAGGAMDLVSRALAAVMSESMGQQAVVENRTGGQGMIGAQHVARAAPDGYTLLMYADAHAIAPAVFLKLNFDPIRDFAPMRGAAAAL